MNQKFPSSPVVLLVYKINGAFYWGIFCIQLGRTLEYDKDSVKTDGPEGMC